MRRKYLTRLGGLALAGLLLAMVAGPASAQTPEGTVITNTAYVDYTDANGNSYATESASANVTVGYQAGVDVIAAAASVTPGSPSTDDTLYFDVANIGNGTDIVQLDTNTTVAGLISNVRFWYNSSVYGTLAAINAQLASATDSLAQADTIEIRVIYDVNSGQGGQTTRFELTATTQRAGSPDSDMDFTDINPPAAYAVAVLPDDSVDAAGKLPSNGTQYTYTFRVENNGNAAEDIDLTASGGLPGSITIVSVDGNAGSTAQINVASTSFQNVDVVFTIGNVAAGTQDTVFLNAEIVANPATTDDGTVRFTVIRPSITVTKAAFRDVAGSPGAAVGAGTVVPGEFIWYRIEVTNGGTADASTVAVADTLPTEVTYDSNSDDAGSPSWVWDVSGDPAIAASLTTVPPATTRTIWIRVQIN